MTAPPVPDLRVVAIYRHCKSLPRTARLAGRSVPDTLAVLREAGYCRPRGPRKRPVTRQVLALLAQGLTRHEVQRQLGLTCQHISVIMRRKRDVIAQLDQEGA
jgi:hypothetical protein